MKRMVKWIEGALGLGALAVLAALLVTLFGRSTRPAVSELPVSPVTSTPVRVQATQALYSPVETRVLPEPPTTEPARTSTPQDAPTQEPPTPAFQSPLRTPTPLPEPDLLSMVQDVSLSPDGSQILFISRHPGEERDAVFVMARDSGQVSRFLDLPAEVKPRQVDWSPDGRRAAVAVYGSGEWGFDDIYVVRADGTDPTCLTANLDDSIMDLAWSPDGLKIACITEPADYSRPDNLVVCHVQDQNCTRFTVRAFAVGGVGGYIAWSPDSNRLAIGYQPGVGLGKLVLVDLAENAVKPLPQPAGYRAPHPLWFPDGERIGFFATEEEQDAEPEFWILTLETRELERIVALPASEGRFSSGSYPQWLSESEILFYSDRALWSMRVDGSAPQRLTPGGLTIYLGRAPVVSPISHEMAFVTKEWFSVTSGAHASRIAILDLMDGQLDVK